LDLPFKTGENKIAGAPVNSIDSKHTGNSFVVALFIPDKFRNNGSVTQLHKRVAVNGDTVKDMPNPKVQYLESF